MASGRDTQGWSGGSHTTFEEFASRLTFPEPNHVICVLKLSQSNVDRVLYDKIMMIRPEALNGRLSASTGVAKAYLARLDKMHDKPSVCDDLDGILTHHFL